MFYEDVEVAAGLRRLARTVADVHPGDGMDAESGRYGVEFENDVFTMHPYCWCDRDDCAWCVSCSCPDEVFTYRVKGVVTDFDTWLEADPQIKDILRDDSLQCGYCREGRRAFAPNFMHKRSGSRVSWYKYIGRDMDVEIHGDWAAVLMECVNSLTPSPEPSVEGADGEGGRDD